MAKRSCVRNIQNSSMIMTRVVRASRSYVNKSGREGTEASAICFGAHCPFLPKIIPRRLIASFNTSSRGRAPELSLFHTLSKASRRAGRPTSPSTNTELCQLPRQVRSFAERVQVKIRPSEVTPQVKVKGCFDSPRSTQT